MEKLGQVKELPYLGLLLKSLRSLVGLLGLLLIFLYGNFKSKLEREAAIQQYGRFTTVYFGCSLYQYNHSLYLTVLTNPLLNVTNGPAIMGHQFPI